LGEGYVVKKKRMTKAQMRVAIAKDVLTQIKLKKLEPTSGVYLDKSFVLREDDDISKQVLQQLPKKNCAVCAVGACFVSSLKLFNKYEPSDGYGWRLFGNERVKISSYSMRSDQLAKHFSYKQLDVIEAAFERSNEYSYRDQPMSEKKVGNFSRKYKTDTDLMVAIMKNIIKNKGLFKP
jgi:hypothetical protein